MKRNVHTLGDIINLFEMVSFCQKYYYNSICVKENHNKVIEHSTPYKRNILYTVLKDFYLFSMAITQVYVEGNMFVPLN